jgi:hypothetical protein
MPRIAKDPSIPLFHFELNPEKPNLSTTTVNIYRTNLNKITAKSYEQSLTDKRKKPILNKKDLLTKSPRVISIINEIGEDNRAKKCALYSAVFYAVGSKNLKRNKKMSTIVEAFRAVYNDDKYQDYKQKKVEADEMAGQED